MLIKRKNVFVEFNTSKNPFAYIRSEKDVDVFIKNIKNAAEEQGRLTNSSENALRLLWIISVYLLEACIEDDRSIETLMMLLKRTCAQVATRDKKTTFEYMLENWGNEGAKTKYDFFKQEVYGTYSDLYQKAVQKCLDFLSSIQSERFIVGLLDEKFPRQAIFKDKKQKHEVWFNFTDSFKICKHTKINKRLTFSTLNIPKFLFDKTQHQPLEIFLPCPSMDFKSLLIFKSNEFLKWLRESQETSPQETKDPNAPHDSEKPLFGECASTSGREFINDLYCERAVAIHEAGHAVAAYLLNVKLYGVSIIPNSFHTGHVSFADTKNLALENNIIITYAGEVAEQVLFANAGIAPYTDLEYVVQKVKETVLSEGELHEIAYKYKFLPGYELGLKDGEYPYVIYETINRCMKYYTKTYELIEQNKNLVQALSEELIKKKSFTGSEVESFLNTLIGVYVF